MPRKISLAKRSSCVSPQAQKIIGKYARYKAIAVAFNPIIIAELIGGLVADLGSYSFLCRSSTDYRLPLMKQETC